MAIRVTAYIDEKGERFLQRFKRLCLKNGLFKELKRRRFYEKPSDRRRREVKESRRALAKAERRKKDSSGLRGPQ